MKVTMQRFGGTCGIAAGVLFLVGLALLDLPGHDDGDARLNAFYGEQGNRLRIALGAYSWAVAGLALLGTGAALGVRAEERGGSPGTVRVMTLGCGACAVLLIAAAAAQAPTYALSIDAFDEPQSELTRATIPHIGWSLLLFSMLGGAVFAGATGVAIRQTRMLPAGIGWMSFAAAALLPLSVMFMPIFLLPAWTVATGVGLLWGSTRG